jgi:hypothetical protein
MRISTSILCLALCGTALAADTYRWVDKDGVVHYSDQPNPGAERIPLTTAPLPGSVAPQQAPARPAAGPATQPVYAGCEISSPNPDQVFTNTTAVGASVSVLPGLQSGHRITMRLNGQIVQGWPDASQSYQLQDLARGSYTLQALIVDGANRPVCSSRALMFHVRQPSMLTPGAKAAPR